MFKAVAFASVLFVAAIATDIEDFESNLIEYDVPVHLPKGIALPYPYRETKKNIVVEPLYYSDTYETVVVPPVPTEVGVSKLGLIATIASYAFSFTKAAIVFLFVNGPALSLGSLVALGLCKFTPICSKLSGVKWLLEAEQEFRSFATPDRLTRAANFVQKALNKYNSIQNDE